MIYSLKFISIIYTTVKFRAKLLINMRLCILLLILSQNVAYTQLDKVKKLKDHYTTKLDTLKSNSIDISGSIYLDYALTYAFNEKKNSHNYKLGGQLNINYKGFTIPLQYIYSNGRSIRRFNGPNINTPKFNIVGISPTFKWATIHIGDRIMSFSKYTYDNIRFRGAGFDLNPGNFYLKGFRGKLSPLNFLDLNFRASNQSTYERIGWGSILGYKSEKIDLSGILFSANDNYSETKYSENLPSLPKENTAVSGKVIITPIDKLEFQYERSVSALTRNAFDAIEDIKTHNTIYNMLGLFTKKESSVYNYAGNVSMAYKEEIFSISIELETIDKGYQTLGSLLYDNNFRDYKLSGNYIFKKSIHTNSSLGWRQSKQSNSSFNSGSKFIFNHSSSYNINDKNNLFLNFSNFKQIDNLYLRSINSTEVDSVILTNVNNNLSLGYNLTLGEDEPYVLSFVSSFQNSNSIQYDTLVTGNTTTTFLTSITINKILSLHNLTLNFNYLSNSGNVQNKTFTTNLSHQFLTKSKINFNNSIGFNRIDFGSSPIYQLILSSSVTYDLNKKTNMSLDNRLDFNNSNKRFEPFTFFSNIKLNYNF